MKTFHIIYVYYSTLGYIQAECLVNASNLQSAKVEFFKKNKSTNTDIIKINEI